MKIFCTKFASNCLLYVACLLIPLGLEGQKLAIRSLTADPFDISSRTSSVKDRNGIPCALVKIICNDKVKGVQGSVVQTVDNTNEYWAYITSGAKEIRVQTLHHSPLSIPLTKYLGSGAVSGTTYILELESDLPPEVLFGTSNPFAPINMAKEGEPELPKWWNSQENELYVGISAPTYDAKTAKQMAILNALFMYAQSKDEEIEYRGITDMFDAKDECYDKNYQSYSLKSGTFRIDICQEYYNPKGEYFVLCRIVPDADSLNSFEVRWSSLDDYNCQKQERKYELTSYLKAKLQIESNNLETDYAYSIKSFGDSVKIDCTVGEKSLINENMLRSDMRDDLTQMKIFGSIGLCQTRLLSALACVPDSMAGNGRLVSDGWAILDEDGNEKEAETKLFGTYEFSCSGRNQPRKIQLVDYSDGLRFSIEERFPRSYRPNNMIVLSTNDLYGLSNNYQQYIESNQDYTDFNRNSGTSEDDGTSFLLEYKNSSLISAFKKVEHTSLIKECISYDESEMVQTDDELIIPSTEITIPKVKIYPLWLLDPSERLACKKKKDLAEWQKYQNEWEKEVWILSPKGNGTKQ